MMSDLVVIRSELPNPVIFRLGVFDRVNLFFQHLTAAGSAKSFEQEQNRTDSRFDFRR
jgi:hypothetical protein